MWLRWLESTFVAILMLSSAPPTVRAQGKHMLFRARGPNGATVYLLGSVHLLSADAGALPAVVDSAFAHAKAIAFEASIDTLEMRAPELVSQAQYPADSTLRSSISPAALPKVEALLASYGLTLDQVARYRPWFIALLLEQAVMQRANFQPQYGVDAQLNERAKSANKPRLSLESVDVQMRLLVGLTPEQQEEELLDLKVPDEAVQQLEMLKAMWLAGNAAGLDSVTHAGETPASAKLDSVLVVDRNLNWLPQIETWLRGKDDILVVVGAGHLVGKSGIVALLRAKGYTVDQQ